MRLADFYGITAGSYEELHGDEQQEKMGIIKQHISLKKTDLLLDVGCATGISMDFACIVVGIDPQLELLRLNKHKGILQARSEFLPFKDGCFDIVLSITSLHNFTDIKKGIEEMKRVGKDRFVFSILKRSRHFPLIENTIRQHFSIAHKIDSKHDTIFICK